MSEYAKDRHKRAAMALGNALTEGAESSWAGLTIILMARLNSGERAMLADSVLNSLTEDHAYKVASMALFGVLHGEVL